MKNATRSLPFLASILIVACGGSGTALDEQIRPEAFALAVSHFDGTR